MDRMRDLVEIKEEKFFGKILDIVYNEAANKFRFTDGLKINAAGSVWWIVHGEGGTQRIQMSTLWKP